MAHATGEWLTFVDADDRLEPNHLELLMEGTKEENPDIVIGGYKQYRVKEGTNGTVFSHEIPAEGAVDLRFVAGLSTSIVAACYSKVYRVSFLKASGILFDAKYTVSEDAIWVRQLMLQAKEMRVIPLSGYRYICSDVDSAMSRYHACFEDVKAKDTELMCQMMERGGCSSAEIDEYRNGERYIDGYFMVCNLFKQGSPLSFGERRREVRRLVFNDAAMRAAIEAQDRSKHNLFLKIYDRAYDTGSAWWMTVIFQLQYSLKYSLMPLYLKIAPRLRR